MALTRIPDLSLLSRNLDVLSRSAQTPTMGSAEFHQSFVSALKGGTRLLRLAASGTEGTPEAAEIAATHEQIGGLFEQAKAAESAAERGQVSMPDSFAEALHHSSGLVARAEEVAAKRSAPDRHVFDYQAPEERLVPDAEGTPGMDNRVLRAAVKTRRFPLQSLLERLGHHFVNAQVGPLLVVGAEHLPKDGPFVFLMNHGENNLDAAILAQAMRKVPAPVRVMRAGGAGLFRILDELLARVYGAFPVYAGQGTGTSSEAVAKQFLGRGQVVTIYQEGTRVHPAMVGTHYAGGTRIALDSHVPVVVGAVSGLKTPETQGGPARRPVLYIQEPISTADIPATEHNQEVLQDLAQAKMQDAFERGTEIWEGRGES